MKKPFIIGIAGGTASGKTTFTDKLEKALSKHKICVIHMDSYFKPENERPYSEAPVSGKMYIDDNHPLTMDLPKLFRDLLDIIDNSLHDIVIIEGLLTLWDKDIYSKLDLKLFVECNADERTIRRLKRNMEWGLSFEEISDVYLNMVRYRHDEFVKPTKWKADIIINGSTLPTCSVDMVASYVNCIIES